MRSVFKTAAGFTAAVILIFSAAAEAVTQPTVSELLTGVQLAVVDALYLDGQVFRYDEEQSGPLYLPEGRLRKSVRARHEVLSPEVMVEALYRIPYPEDAERQPDEVLEALYRLSHKVSDISGTIYYSERRKKYDVLFSKVYAVDDAESRRRVPDPEPVGTESSILLHMKENALGRAYYRLDLEIESGILTVAMENISRLGLVVKAVEPGDMEIRLQIVPCSDAILIYGYCGVVLQNDDLIRLLLDPYFAFYRRMTAMETWLYNSLHDTDELPPVLEPRP